MAMSPASAVPATTAAAAGAPEAAAAPLVTIVLITQNRAAMLPRCLRTLFAQSWRPLEIVVVDDGSTDATPATLEQCGAAAGDLPFRVLRHPSNRGIGAARNTGIAAAGGEWIAFTDDDCEAAPDWIAQLVQTGRAHPDAAIVGGAIDEPPRPTWAQRASEGLNHLGRAAAEVPAVVGCNMAFRASFLRAHPFDAGARSYADELDRCLVARAHGLRIRFTPAARVVHHHRHTIASFLRQQWRRGAGSVWVRARHGAGLWPRKNFVVAALAASPLAFAVAPGTVAAGVVASCSAAFVAQTVALDRRRGKSWRATLATLPLVLAGYVAEFGGALHALARGRRQ
jgi:glycosyltransferase involved in cell wall biosynthesis